ncbi:MAG: MFS transporter, partial [Proteobacteria bacterium]|nr:MFS transporter [Pseudomonadota bacterium]
MAFTLPAAVERNYRFLVLFASLGLMLMGTGSMFLMSVLLKPIAQDFGWTRSIPSLAFSALYIGGGLGGIVMGIWMDRRGMGRPALVAALMVSAGTFMASRVQSEWDLYLVYGVMLGLLGQGALFSPLMANIIRWFEHKRGTAVGVVASGQSLAGAMWPPLIRYVNEAEGWRETFVWFSGLAFIVMVPLSMIMWRAAPGTEERAAARAAQRVEREQGGTRRRAVAPGATVLSPAG